MGPPLTSPVGEIFLYFTPRVHSTNLVVIPNIPATIIQNVAPGPPTAMATATKEILPNPNVPLSAADKAWNGVTSPSSVFFVNCPKVIFHACPNARTLINRK